MSLFEKIKNKRYGLQEENKKKKFQKPSDPWFSDSSKNVNPTDSKEISSRLSASTTKGDQARSQYNPDGGYGDSDVGDQQTTKGRNKKTFSKNIPSTTTVGGKNKPQSDASEFTKRVNRANKNRKEFIKGRQTYTDSKTGIEPGKPTKEGIKKYISKARNMSQGTNANTKANKKAAEVIAQSASKEYADKITKKYETDKRMIKTRKPIKTVAQLTKEIDSRPPDGRTIKKILKPELEKIKPKVTTGNQIPFVQTPPKELKKIATPELEKIKPKVTSSKTAFVQPPAKKKILTQTQKLSQKLMKNKNKYAKIAGVTLATGAAILGTNRVMQAQKKQKKAIAALAKDNPKNYTPVDVDLFLNKSGTSPSPSKVTTPKITTPKNNPKSKYTSGVSNAAKSNATLPYNSNKIASYAKPSQRSSKK